MGKRTPIMLIPQDKSPSNSCFRGGFVTKKSLFTGQAPELLRYFRHHHVADDEINLYGACLFKARLPVRGLDNDPARRRRLDVARADRRRGIDDDGRQARQQHGVHREAGRPCDQRRWIA